MSHLTDRDWHGKRATVMGLGRFGGGLGVTRWLVSQGAIVTVSDQAPAEDLAQSVAALNGLDVTLHLGGHQESDFTLCDVLVANPAVPFDSPNLAAARRAGALVTTEIVLFMARCPAPIVGVTGSAGKSTTTAMIGEILARQRPTHVGGNIGKSLLGELDAIAPDHWVVLELSSFQLTYLPPLARSPHVALVTNLQPNHLDRHKDMAEYADAKQNIFRFQQADDVLVLNRDDAITRNWGAEARGRIEFYGMEDKPFQLALPGRHNQTNAQAAWAAARQLGVTRAQAQAALAGFRGLPHRLQLVAEHGGVRYYNDSKCTSPNECLVALDAFAPRSMVIIVGGYDKKVDLSELCRALADKAKIVVATGAVGGLLAKGVLAVRSDGLVPNVVLEPMFDRAVARAAELARPGDAVVLSPACASFDHFKNYEQRGEVFAEQVRKLTGRKVE